MKDVRQQSVPSAQFTPESTVGPFFPGIFVSQMPQDLVRVAPLITLHPHGQAISLTGRVLDEAGAPVQHAILEFWQANAQGRYRHPLDTSPGALDPQFDGFARVCTDAMGEFRLVTIKPGAYKVSPQSSQSRAEEVVRAPHLRLTLLASGVDRLYTQIFFEDEVLKAMDPLLMSVDETRRTRLIAARVGENDGTIEYRLDIRMRGEDETPFFDDWRNR